MRQLWQGRAGTTLVEMVVGGAVAILILGVIIQMQVQAWRYQQADDARFTAQAESALLLERLLEDGRRASAYSAGEGTVTLTVDGEPVTYAFAPAAGQVTRTAGEQTQVLARSVEDLRFTAEGERLLRVEVTIRLPGGASQSLSTRIALRSLAADQR